MQQQFGFKADILVNVKINLNTLSSVFSKFVKVPGASLKCW